MKKSFNFLSSIAMLILGFINIVGKYSLIDMIIETLQNIYRNIMFNEPFFSLITMITVLFISCSYLCCIANILLSLINKPKKFLTIVNGIISIISLILVIFITHSFGFIHIILSLLSLLMIIYPIWDSVTKQIGFCNRTKEL